MCELLAPAGSYESIIAAVNAGADAVYAGGPLFGARAYADNPDEERLIRGLEYCHLHGRKLYLTVNTLLKERELETVLGQYLLPYYENGLDGLIVQDLGVMRYVKECFPDLPIHASTQMTITGADGARLLQQEGVGRVVVARELSLEEIRGIIEETGVEVEAFVHGAMCYSYSGQCLFSSLLGGRSGNRGRCAQPCRLPYRLAGAKEPARYLLSMKDMCALDLLPELLDAGIASLKIEGRMKRPEYTAGVVSVYRKYLDRCRETVKENYRVEEEDRGILLDLYSRGDFSQGYYHAHNGRHMMSLYRPNYKGTTEARQLVRERYIDRGISERISGTLSIPAQGPAVLNLECRGVRVRTSRAIGQPALNRPTDEDAVRRQMLKTGNTAFEFEKLDISLAEGLFVPVAELNALRRAGLELLKGKLLERSRRDCSKVRETVKEKRTPAAVEAAAHKEADMLPATPETDDGRSGPCINILVTDERQLKVLLESDFSGIDTVYLDSLLFALLLSEAGEAAARERAEKLIDDIKKRGWKCFLAGPGVMRERERSFLSCSTMQEVLGAVDGFLLHTIDELSYFQNYIREYGVSAQLAADDSLYAYNRRAEIFLRDHGVGRFTLPAELNHRELRELNRENAELVVYGYQALMQSAQCVIKNTKGCAGTPAIIRLKDRKNAEFPVLSRCPFCRNTIYNSVPLMLTGCREEIARLSPSYLRLSFTIESERETRRILKECARALSGTEHVTDIGNRGTRGHFRRGVE